MALRKIVYEGDPLLRKKSRAVTDITERIRLLAEDMFETMYDANGVGLAAPQVGVLRRLAVIDVTPPAEEDMEEEADENAEEDAYREAVGEIASGSEAAPEVLKFVLINPEIVEVSEEVVSAQEGCLSVPGMVGTVVRPARIKVRALDIDGRLFEVEGEGMLAKALMHEIDHLDGILYTDKAESVSEVDAE
jgi:peptide deformylase